MKINKPFLYWVVGSIFSICSGVFLILTVLFLLLSYFASSGLMLVFATGFLLLAIPLIVLGSRQSAKA